MMKLLPLCAALLLTACAASASVPASSPPPASSPRTEPQPAGATEAQREATVRGDLKVDLATVDSALADLGRRLELARDDAKANVTQQLAALHRREDALEAQLRDLGTLADADAEKARREIHQALVEMQLEAKQLAERISR